MVKLNDFYKEVMFGAKELSNRHIKILNLDFGGENKDDFTMCDMNIQSLIDNKEYFLTIRLKIHKSLLLLATNEYIYTDFEISKTELDSVYIYDCIRLLEFLMIKYNKFEARNYTSLNSVDKFYLAVFKLQNCKSNTGNL
ncbi:hypothetical protein FNU3_48 [Fusobacterium phage vB_FnuS_FNU3]|uniref:Uncharacterized protein n=1 Tax=Fusobacterium phage Fnu1 TaxID=2530024 RepID=A0A481W6K6_9CAUD|nr:hypothetical protein KMD24_gp158 [Fusobacterium phage Fnu1]QBJ04153.1 hypothetical protein [Fusobacterium phage Fnu1]WGH50273.1 hypothetical protein FNU2_83 [Fusobacterium phage vB_FnuS_FNU2]WGH50413.1 hypothetical protein FNU3_48 [Fusobacterium phage vB_FnuS_FNU3]